MGQQYTLDGSEARSEGVYSVVAAIEDCSPLDLLPLAESIDPDALDTLLTGDTDTNQVSFEYYGYLVTATPREIHVQESAHG